MKKKYNSPTISNKIKVIHIFFVIFALLLVLFAGRWQIIDAAKFDLRAKSRIQNETLTSTRGAIFAKDGTTLAYTEPRVKVSIWLPDLAFYKNQTREELINKVAPIIDTTAAELTKKINDLELQGTNNIILGEDLTKEQWEKIKNLKTDSNPDVSLRGFSYEFLPKRIYPEGRLASQLIGLTNSYKNELIGVGGIERRYNDALNPVEGLVSQETDARGFAITSALSQTIEPQNGSDVYLTINKKLQAIVEAKIKEGVEKYEAKSGSVIIMDPKTGEIMAMANYPDYDPNVRAETDPSAYGNLTITSPYEIGSIGKIITISTAIDLGLITPDTIIMPNGHQGCEKIHQDLEPVCTWDKMPQPPMPAKDCFQKSDNLCFYHIATLINKKDFYDHLTDFGVGYLSGVDLKEESIGFLKPYDSWNVGDVAAFSYGHGYLVNQVQAINYAATIANYGVRMQPLVIDKIVTPEGKETVYNPTVIKRAVSKETAETVVDMMRYNYSKSLPEWYYWDLHNYDIGIKSGTALIANSTGYSVNINATFVGFDASPERTFVMLVKLEDPRIPAYDRLAFYNVRPLWLDTFEAVKDIIGVPTK